MTKWKLALVGIGATFLLTAGILVAKDHKTSLTGTWDCVAHGTSQGDMKFTLVLQQSKEVVDGNITSPLGATEITSGALRKKDLELHFDFPQGGYTLMARLENGKLTGAWSLESDKGAWEGTKREPTGK